MLSGFIAGAVRCGQATDIPCQMQMAKDTGEAVEALGVWDQPGWAKLPHEGQVSLVGSTLPHLCEWVYSAPSCQLALCFSCHIVAGRAKVRWDLGHSHSHKEPITPCWWPDKTGVLEETALTDCVGRTSDRASMASTATGSPPVPGCHRPCR